MTKRITILGAGESGTGAAILAKVKGYDVFVSDLNTIKDKYKADLQAHEIELEEGKHTEEKILSAELVVKSPGISDKAEIIRKVKDAGLPVIDEIEFAYSFLRGKTVAITGTNGKTTTTLLTYHLMKTSGFNVGLAGNVGESFARKVALDRHDWYVLEVSSFQLDGTVKFRPDIGVRIQASELRQFEIPPDRQYDNRRPVHLLRR
jgi:UDP-N-acetylmuramoylalanine--D-glutamate ligase